MRRRSFLLAILPFCAVSARADDTPADDFTVRARTANWEWNRYYRKLEGCPPNAREVEECKSILGENSPKGFAKARHAMAKFFGFEE